MKLFKIIVYLQYKGGEIRNLNVWGVTERISTYLTVHDDVNRQRQFILDYKYFYIKELELNNKNSLDWKSCKNM